VDFDSAEWRILDANSKTGRGFTVPLTPAVLEWFKSLQSFTCGSRYVLPARQQQRHNANRGDVPFVSAL
jgi:hypothetical protein